ncbi:MAG: hypothetical protein K2Y29_13375 [Beijerinckiaceae bacterium]|nr:hypothetical protein [Beijerinckiaceae bacterium]
MFAGFLSVLFASPQASAQPAPKGDRELGQYLSSECVACHQESGRAQGVPAIVGWPEEQFVAVMLSYKNRERPNEIMQSLAGRLSQTEIEALAAWFGGKAPAEPAK